MRKRKREILSVTIYISQDQTGTNAKNATPRLSESEDESTIAVFWQLSHGNPCR